MPLAGIRMRLLGLMVVWAVCWLIACGGAGAASTAGPAQSPALAASVDSVAVSPTALAMTAGGQNQFEATIQGTGSFNPVILWSAQRGSITSTGLYTAPVTGGSDVVTAASGEDPGKCSMATIQVTAGGVAAPLVSGPAEVQELSGPYSAKAVLASGLAAQWSITGGTLLSPASGATVQFQAGSAPIATLGCTVSNGTAHASSQRWMVALPFPPRNYLADTQALLAANAGSVSSEIASGDAGTYYFTSYSLMGLAASVEASGDPTVMAALVGFIQQLMAQAQPLVRNGVTYPEWGPWDGNGNPQQLNTFQATGPLARTAAIIAKNPRFLAQYGAVLGQIVGFVDQSIFKYWFDKVSGVYSSPGSPWLGGTVPWLPTALGGWGSYAYWIDTCSHFGMMATWMYQATGNPLYLEYATRVANGFRTHLAVQNGCWIWDQGAVPIEVGDNQDGSPDTSHSNREAMMVVAMYEAGIGYTLADVQLLAATFTNVIWNQDSANPMFSNYIDGSNLVYRTSPAWANGVVFLGWDMVGKYSAQAQRVLAICDQAILAGTPQNPSLASNASLYGKLELAGALARNGCR